MMQNDQLQELSRQKQQAFLAKYASDGNLIRDQSAAAGAFARAHDPNVELANEQEASRVAHDMKVSKSIGNHLAQQNLGNDIQI
jgi:hypothetical protein